MTIEFHNFRIQILDGPHAGKLKPITRSGIVMGRDNTCDVLIDGDGVSRQHAKLSWTDDVLEIVDLESLNGVLVNETKIETRRELHLGDTIQISACQMKLVHSNPNYLENKKKIYIALSVCAFALFFSALRLATTEGPEVYNVEILSEPLGAEVYNNADLKGKTALHYKGIPPGSYNFVLRKDGYHDKEISIEVPVEKIVTFKLTPVSKAVNPEKSIQVRVLPAGSDIYVDGVFYSNTEIKTKGFSSFVTITGKEEVAVYSMYQGQKSKERRLTQGEVANLSIYKPDALIEWNGQRFQGMFAEKDEKFYSIYLKANNLSKIPLNEMKFIRKVKSLSIKQEDEFIDLLKEKGIGPK
ncbi:MAG: FHA domain-containing protein [Lentisphaeria bacterium]|nr:FHA domain-containing protein [Lentisphaeria bacterium]